MESNTDVNVPKYTDMNENTETKKKTQEIITQTSDTVVLKQHENDTIYFAKIWYPMKNLSAYVTEYINFDQKNKAIEVIRVTITESHRGTYRIAYVELDEPDFQHLFSIAQKIASKDDFNALVKEITAIEKRLNKEVTKQFATTIGNLLTIETNTKLLQMLQNKAEVRRILELYTWVSNEINRGDEKANVSR